MSKKRNRPSVFDAIHQLETEDVRANRKRKTTSSSEAAKSKAAKSQTKIYGHLMECRILLQRAMGSSGSEDSYETCNQLLVRLLEARQKLSSAEDEDQDYSDMVESDDLPNLLQSEYDGCRDHWKRVLNQRHKDLRLHAGLTAKAQFRVMDSTFWQQVDATVSHEQLRLPSQDDEEVTPFEDSKVYQHMLQDFVLASGGGGAEEMAAQRLRRAKKESAKAKDVDRRASKGRKIRYATHPKLVNFTFPVARTASTTTGMDEDEWFRSLFGGAANKKSQQGGN